MDAVRCFIDKSQDKWDEYLQQLAGALRCSVNRHTGCTPNKMMLGREINQPADLMFRTPENTVETEEEFVTELQEAMVSAHETARKTLQTAQMRMKRDYDVKVLQREFQVGDLVYVLDSATTKGVNKKLTAPWKGPAVVITKLTPYLYRIRDRKADTVVNHDRLKRCTNREVPLWASRFKKRVDNGKSGANEDITSQNQQVLYCICRKPFEGRFMIECSECLEWFHGDCVNITPRQARFINEYVCPQCKDE